jgi:hypothetical protein
MEVANTSEKSINFYQITRRNLPEDRTLSSLAERPISEYVVSKEGHSLDPILPISLHYVSYWLIT